MALEVVVTDAALEVVATAAATLEVVVAAAAAATLEVVVTTDAALEVAVAAAVHGSAMVFALARPADEISPTAELPAEPTPCTSSSRIFRIRRSQCLPPVFLVVVDVVVHRHIQLDSRHRRPPHRMREPSSTSCHHAARSKARSKA